MEHQPITGTITAAELVAAGLEPTEEAISAHRAATMSSLSQTEAQGRALREAPEVSFPVQAVPIAQVAVSALEGRSELRKNIRLAPKEHREQEE
jgi:hypothetical protein